jgi:hypothetical protein
MNRWNLILSPPPRVVMVIFYLKKIEYCLLSSICAIGRAQLPSFMNMPKERQKTLCSDFENILMTAYA